MPSGFQRVAVAALACCILSPEAQAQSPRPRVDLALEAQDLETALLAVARSSGREILFTADLVAGRRSGPLRGRYRPEEAVRRLLRGTGLRVRLAAGAILIEREDTSIDAGEDVVVTGTRIRGALAYAPVTSLGRDEIRSSGQTNLGDALRQIPQNFSGGQSPYVGTGAEDRGSINLTSASAINLRGLGPDATLTLLNGRRLAYGGITEGVDVSSIPLAAIDRVEVVADGASAIYGSDAVAGVANILLRRDFSGLNLSGRVGAATDGGDVQQQVDGVIGGVWTGGGLVATVSYDRNSEISAGQRRVSRIVDDSLTILPRADHVAALVSGHQAAGDMVEIDLDLLYSRRTTFSTFTNDAGANYRQGGTDSHPTATSILASPAIQLRLGGSWSGMLSGSYGIDTSGYRTRYYSGGAVAIDYSGSYRNVSAGGEGSVEGALASLPGGDVRIAMGAGYRWVGLTARNRTGAAAATGFDGSRESVYGFGELNVPLIGPANAGRGVERLGMNVAGRFEHYPRIGDVFTPKVGLLYVPVRAVELHATWGRSFKAPTLYQLYQGQNAYNYFASAFGGVGLPPTATAIYFYGGNLDLRPQRATNWSVGTSLSLLSDRRLTFEVSYFSTRYTDRIVAPITVPSNSLGSTLYTSLVQRNPTAAQISAVDAATQFGLFDFTGGGVAPANVVAIIDNRNRNVAVQRVEGVDASAAWRLAVSARAMLALSASATYLNLRQQFIAGQPEDPLAGRIYYPPHLRARGGATLSGGGWTGTATATVIGSVEDDRYSPRTRIGGQALLDLALGYAIPPSAGSLRGLGIQVAILNAFNDQPERIRNAIAYNTPFDGTNYNPVGRLVSLTVTKQW